MLIFESTKTNIPITQQDLALILISLPHTYIHNHGNDNRVNKRRWHTSIFKQKPTQISCVKQCKINFTHISRRNNITSASASSPSCFLSSLHCWKAAPKRVGPTCLIVTLLFNVLFLWHFPLYHLPFIVDLLISVLYTQIECTFLSLHHCKIRPLLLIGCKCGLGYGPTLRSKAFFKNCLVHLKLCVIELNDTGKKYWN